MPLTMVVPPCRRAPRERGFSQSKPRYDIITHYNAATQALIRRKVSGFHGCAMSMLDVMGLQLSG